MKNFIKRTVALTVAVLFLFCFAVSASAAKNYVKWEMSDDEMTLTGDGVVYTRYNTPAAFYVDAQTVYRYEKYLSQYSDYISAPYKDADFVWITNNYYEPVIYCATDDARAALDRFFAGEGEYHITDGYYGENADISDKVAAAVISADGATRTEDVVSLKYDKHFELALYDETHTFYYTLGMLFRIDGSYWYVDYSSLVNQHFDADGNFSFRSGEVTLYAVDGAYTDYIDDAEDDMEYTYTDYSWEDYDPYYENDDTEVSMTVFFVSYSILGFVIPLAIGVLTVVFAQFKKLGKPKYLYSVTTVCAVWILCAAAIAVIMLV